VQSQDKMYSSKSSSIALIIKKSIYFFSLFIMIRITVSLMQVSLTQRREKEMIHLGKCF